MSGVLVGGIILAVILMPVYILWDVRRINKITERRNSEKVQPHSRG